MKDLPMSYLVPTGRVLLMGGFGLSLLQAIRGKCTLSDPFEKVVIGMCALSFYFPAGAQLEALSEKLTASISALGHQEDLKALLLDAFKKAANEPVTGGGGTSVNLPAVFEQAWRTGVWGVMTSFVDGIFLLASFVLECAQEVLWKLLLFLFPLGAGLYPVFPKMLLNLVIYAIELSLWFPVLTLIEAVTGSVAKGHLLDAGSWGLYIIGVEVVAILLILLIPAVTHQFVSGAFAGDFNSQRGVIDLAKKVVHLRSYVGGGGSS